VRSVIKYLSEAQIAVNHAIILIEQSFEYYYDVTLADTFQSTGIHLGSGRSKTCPQDNDIGVPIGEHI
jgi:hypothetical protein